MASIVESQWTPIEVEMEMPLWIDRMDAPTTSFHATLLKNEEGLIYNDDRRGLIRAKSLGGCFLRTGAILSYFGGPELLQGVKFLKSSAKIVTTDNASRKWRKATLKAQARQRFDKLKGRLRELPRDLSYQTRMLYNTGRTAIAFGDNLFERRKKVGDLEWEHTRHQKDRCLMVCFQPLNYHINNRAKFAEDPIQKLFLDMHQQYVDSTNIPALRQYLHANWILDKRINYDSYVAHEGKWMLGMWYGPELSPARREFERRLGFHSIGPEDTSKPCPPELYEHRFDGTPFRVLKAPRPSLEGHCFGSCMLFIRDLPKLLDCREKDLVETCADLSRMYSLFVPDEAFYEQAIYETILGSKCSSRKLDRYIRAIEDESKSTKKLRLLPLIRAYQNSPDNQRISLREFVIERSNTKLSKRSYALLGELGLRFAQTSDPAFDYKLQAKNAMGAKYGLIFEEWEGDLEEGIPYMLNYEDHVKVLMKLPSGKHLLFDTETGIQILDDYTPGLGVRVLSVIKTPEEMILD